MQAPEPGVQSKHAELPIWGTQADAVLEHSATGALGIGTVRMALLSDKQGEPVHLEGASCPQNSQGPMSLIYRLK